MGEDLRPQWDTRAPPWDLPVLGGAAEQTLPPPPVADHSGVRGLALHTPGVGDDQVEGMKVLLSFSGKCRWRRQAG